MIFGTSSSARSTVARSRSGTNMKREPVEPVWMGAPGMRSASVRPSAAAISARLAISGPNSGGPCRIQMKDGCLGSPSRVTGTGPMPSSKMNDDGEPGTRPCTAMTHAVPTVGWPANWSSRRGVKMRTRAAQSGRVGGRMKVVSERFISMAMACISPSARPRPSSTTARGLPPNTRSVKTSTWMKRYSRVLTSREHREVDGLLGDELEQRGRPFLGLGDGPLDGGHDLRGLGHPLAVPAEGLRHVSVVAADVRGAALVGGHRHHLELDGHGEVVEQHGQDRDALAHRRLEVHAGEADGGVAPEIDAELVGGGELGAHGEAEAVAELGGLAPTDVGERCLRLPERRDLIPWAARVVRDDGVGQVHCVHEVPDHAIGTERL